MCCSWTRMLKGTIPWMSHSVIGSMGDHPALESDRSTSSVCVAFEHWSWWGSLHNAPPERRALCLRSAGAGTAGLVSFTHRSIHPLHHPYSGTSGSRSIRLGRCRTYARPPDAEGCQGGTASGASLDEPPRGPLRRKDEWRECPQCRGRSHDVRGAVGRRHHGTMVRVGA